MADNTDEQGPEDGKRVNVSLDRDVRWWSIWFGCTEQQLREAVDEVGVMAADVGAYLRSR